MTAIEKYAELIDARDRKPAKKSIIRDAYLSVSALDRANIAATIIVKSVNEQISLANTASMIGRSIAPDLFMEDDLHREAWLKIGMATIQPLDEYGVVQLQRGSDYIKTDPTARRSSLYTEWVKGRSKNKKGGDRTPYTLRPYKTDHSNDFLFSMTVEILNYGMTNENREVQFNKPLEWNGFNHSQFGNLVSNVNKGAISLMRGEKFQKTLDAVNKLQSTEFFINDEVLCRLKDSRREIIRMMKNDSDSFDSFNSKKYNLDMALGLATKHQGAPLYSPVFLDNRGRTYYGASYLSRSGDDFQKGLLMVQPEPIGAEGYDNLLVAAVDFRDQGTEAKMSRADKLAIAENDVDKFIAVAEGSDYLYAGEPAQFLSVCYAIRNADKMGADYASYKSGILISRDASQSGPMLMGIMTQDENTMKYTNVLKGEKRYDLYEKLGAQMLKELKAYQPKPAKEYVPRHEDTQFGDQVYYTRNLSYYEHKGKADLLKLFSEHPKQIRKWSKYPLMLFGYSGEAQRIGEDLWIKMQHDFKWFTPPAAKMLAKIYYNSCKTTIPAVYQFMVGLKNLSTLTNRMDVDVTNISPYSGFPFMQDYYVMDSREVRPYYKGKKMHIMLKIKSDVRDRHKTRSATAANFVHSIDADLLKMVVNEFPSTIATNHDAFFATPSKIGKLDEILRVCTKKIAYEYRALDDFLAQYGTTPSELGIVMNEIHPEFQPENNEFCYS
jgi:hypothetical protein